MGQASSAVLALSLDSQIYAYACLGKIESRALEIEGVIAKLKRASEDALEATSIEELLGIEGAAASQYFQEFGGMVKVEVTA